MRSLVTSSIIIRACGLESSSKDSSAINVVLRISFEGEANACVSLINWLYFPHILPFGDS